MKKLVYLLLAISFALVSCKNRKKVSQENKEIKTEEVVEETTIPTEEAPKEDVYESSDVAETIAVISLSKSVCFGECPAYSVQFFKDGTVLYEGIKHVKNIGKFKGKTEANEVKAMLVKANEIGFFTLKDKYDNEYVTDLPTAVTYMNFDGKKKKVICRYECDQKITKVNKMIESFIEKLSLKKMG